MELIFPKILGDPYGNIIDICWNVDELMQMVFLVKVPDGCSKGRMGF